MKKWLFTIALLLCLSGSAWSACTLTQSSATGYGFLPDTNVSAEDTAQAYVIVYSMVCTGSGESFSDEDLEIPAAVEGMELREVKLATTTNTTVTAFTIEDGSGTDVWEVTAMSPSRDMPYGGHYSAGIFPLYYGGWTLTTGVLVQNDTIPFTLIFRKGD
jgi:hypothetical protein